MNTVRHHVDDSPRLKMSGIVKRFGATLALDGVDLCVDSGEVLALVGENGAGKSTLMKILSGAIQPDRGQIAIDGVPFAAVDPLTSRSAGIAMIYQESTVAPHLTVEANLMLGVEQHWAGFIRPTALRRRIIEIFARLGRPDIRGDILTADLSPADRQVVEVARALLIDAKVIVMDEPTSSLGLTEIERLFEIIAELRRHGVAIVYISHFLEEVQRVTDRYIVLRDGCVTGVGNTADVSVAELIELMIGRRLPDMFPITSRTFGDPLLVIEGVTGNEPVEDIDLTLRRGEILGIAGLVGAGRTELLRALFGLDRIRSGHVTIRGQTGTNAKNTPADRLSQGVGLLSENRQTEGLALNLSVTQNMLLSRLQPFARWGWLDTHKMNVAVTTWVERLRIRVAHVDQAIAHLSGGNQQKVAFARLLHHDVDVLFLDEPTRGIDVASKAQLYAWIDQLASRGKAILLVSDYVPELLGVCDRIAVMHRGRLRAIRPTKQWTEHEIITVASSGEETVA